MCGIAGFFRPSGAKANSYMVARGMGDRLVHRGPDDSGVWVDEQAGIGLAHRRLAVIDLSPAGRQPMLSPSGRYVVVFNGEIYNHLEVRELLWKRQLAPTWAGHSDTETLAAAIEAMGPTEAMHVCAGMFAFALWDRAERTLTLGRDRLGEKPLYYGWQGGTFLFGSELKALRAHPDFHAEVDRGALSLLLRYSYVPSPYSIYEGIYKLPPGTLLTLSNRRSALEPVRFWSLAAVAEAGSTDQLRGSDEEAVDELEELLRGVIQQQSIADVPLGALLSGGIDSTAVVALMQVIANRPVRTFTIGFAEGGHDESRHAAAVAQHLGTQHTELTLTPGDALDLIPSLAHVYDEPFADSSQLPTQLVMRLARQHVTVALSGDGGDEVFGGYNRYVLAPRVWRYLRLLPVASRRLLAGVLLSLSVERWNSALGRIGLGQKVRLAGEKLHKIGHRLLRPRDLDDLYVALVSEWLEPETAVHDAGEPLATIVTDRRQWPALSDGVARMMAMDAITYLPDDILVKVDRAAMASSLETRAPFLDHRVVEYAWRLPMHLKIRNGKGKWLLRELVARHVPPELFERPKMGFGIPINAWLRGPLRDWAEALLDEPRLRREGYFVPNVIRDAWHAHLQGTQALGYRLWPVLMFQAWLENSSDPVQPSACSEPPLWTETTS